MNKAATLEAERDADYQAQAEYYLAEANKILKRLADERIRSNRRHRSSPNILTTVKAILGKK